MTVLGCSHGITVPKRERKVVIFDSPDSTGKTNMAQGLSLDLRIPYFRMDTQGQNWRDGKFIEALRFDQPYLAEFIRQTKTDVIIDRAYPSEWVYSRVYGRMTDHAVLEEVDRMFARLGAYIVIPLRHDYSNSRKDELVKREDLPRIHERYLEFTQWTRCSTICIYVDAFQDDLKREIEALKQELKFDRQLDFSWNMVLGGSVPEKRDIRAIFTGTDVEPERGIELKAKR